MANYALSPRSLLLSFCDRLGSFCLGKNYNENDGQKHFETKNDDGVIQTKQGQNQPQKEKVHDDLNLSFQLLQKTNEMIESGLQNYVIRLRDNGGRPLPEEITLRKEASQIYKSIVDSALSLHNLFWVMLIQWTLNIAKEESDNEENVEGNQALRSFPHLVSNLWCLDGGQRTDNTPSATFRDLDHFVEQYLMARFISEDNVDEIQVDCRRQTLFKGITVYSAHSCESQQSRTCTKDINDLPQSDKMLSEVLGSIKNFIRLWHLSSSFFMIQFKKCQSEQKQGNSSKFAENPLKILESAGMLRMYNLLYSTEGRCSYESSRSLADSCRLDVAGQACLVLNYLIRGSPQTMLAQLLQPEKENDSSSKHDHGALSPAVQKAAPVMLQSLARGLIGPSFRPLHDEQKGERPQQSIRNLLAHVRLLHVLVACSPSSSSAGQEGSLLSSNDVLYKIGLCLTQAEDSVEETSQVITVPSVLITTLAWALRSTKWDQALKHERNCIPLDGADKNDTSDKTQADDNNDNEFRSIDINESESKEDGTPKPSRASASILQTKAELMEEICNVLFAINMGAKLAANSTKPEEEQMTQLGILIGEILQLPNTAMSLYRVKLACLNLVMDAPKNYAYYLYINQIVEPHLLTVLWIQVTQVSLLNDRDGGGGPSQSDAPIVLPILIVLTKLCQANGMVLKQVTNEIFPPIQGTHGKYDCPVLPDLTSILQIPSPYKKKWRSLPKSTNTDPPNINESKEVDEDYDSPSPNKKSDKMAPEDAPPGTLRNKLINLMTHTDSNIKRCSAELMWTLCHNDSNQFVRRTGFGNAVHLLSIKGLFQIPTSPPP